MPQRELYDWEKVVRPALTPVLPHLVNVRVLWRHEDSTNMIAIDKGLAELFSGAKVKIQCLLIWASGRLTGPAVVVVCHASWPSSRSSLTIYAAADVVVSRIVNVKKNSSTLLPGNVKKRRELRLVARVHAHKLLHLYCPTQISYWAFGNKFF